MSDVAITHPEKMMFPESGITKGELASYYERVAPVMLPHIAGRPVTLERFHRGVGEKGFFQKNVAKGPAWLERVAVPKAGGVVNYPVVRDTLAELGITSWVKTSGSKGFHVAFALDEKSNSGEVARFAHGLGRELVRRAPDRLTQEFYKADRGGKILVDTGRNEFGATFAAAYAVRAKPNAPVSAPCTWEEVESGAALPQSFTLRTMPRRLEAIADPWSRCFDVRYPLPAAL